ncbi:DUF624 domain-containing protein [bacterium]|nr:DUF624 domain-containing protein [bacterium]MDY4583050.1 DUF624 domain-containing protein [Candidatus Faecousia sp.]
MASFWNHFINLPGGYRRKGLGRWFQILEDRFMTLFWANLLCVAWALPFLVSVFFFVQTWDYLALAGMVIGLAILGPGFTALTHICMQLVRDKHVFLWHAYWGSVKRDWKQSVIFALMVGALWGTLAYAVRLVSAVQGGLGPVYTIVFFLNAFLVMGLTLFGFQQIAMVRLPFYGVLKNAFALIFAGGLRSVGAIVFALAVTGVCLWFYEYCVWYLLLGIPALTVMTANLIFCPVFEDFFPEEDE